MYSVSFFRMTSPYTIRTIRMKQRYFPEQVSSMHMRCEECDVDNARPIVQKHIRCHMSRFKQPEEHNMESSINEVDPHRADWVQVNNTLVPCVYRGDHCHLPLNVLQFSAGILGDIDQPHLCPAVEFKLTTVAERMRLDELCTAAKITFPQFPKSTLLISLADLLAVTTRRSQERGLLPKKSKKRKPGKYADLIRELDAECKSTTTRAEDPEILTARSKQKVILSQPRLSKLFLSDTCTPTLKKETSQRTDQQKQKGTSIKHTHSDRGLLRSSEKSSPGKGDRPRVTPLTSSTSVPGVKICLVKFFGKPIPCVVHDYEIYTSTDSLHMIYFNGCGSIKDFHRAFQTVVKTPMVCLSRLVNLLMLPGNDLSSGESLMYVKLKDVATKMEKLSKLLNGTKKMDAKVSDTERNCDKSSIFRKLDTQFDTSPTQPEFTEFQEPLQFQPYSPDVPLDLSMKCKTQPQWTESEPDTVAGKGLCVSRVLPLIEDDARQPISDTPSNHFRRKRKICGNEMSPSSTDKVKGFGGRIVKKKFRLESTISKLMQGKH